LPEQSIGSGTPSLFVPQKALLLSGSKTTVSLAVIEIWSNCAHNFSTFFVSGFHPGALRSTTLWFLNAELPAILFVCEAPIIMILLAGRKPTKVL
jgi:hypothetical protein